MVNTMLILTLVNNQGQPIGARYSDRLLATSNECQDD